MLPTNTQASQSRTLDSQGQNFSPACSGKRDMAKTLQLITIKC
jgi:hypothetical protein